MTNKKYNILKYCATIVMPAFTTFSTAMLTIWDVPYGEAISASIAALNTFIGAIVVKASKDYNKELDNDN